MDTIITFLASIFVIGSLPFWITIALYSIWAFFSLEAETTGLLTFLTIVLGIGAFFAFNPVSPLYLVLSVAGYFLIGGIYSIFKWRNYVKSLVEKYNSGSKTQYERNCLDTNCQPSYHSERFYQWITYWPYSLVWMFCGNIVKSIYNNFSKLYLNIGKKALEKALPVVEKK